MNKKKVMIASFVVVMLIFVGALVFILTKEDEVSTLNLIEKQWIESNKNKVIDLGILNEIPVMNYGGEGVFFDFIQDLEKDTGLSFNKVSYTLGSEVSTDYIFQIVDQVADNDILIYEDYYALLTKSQVSYNKLSDINHITIGVLADDLDRVSNSLVGCDVVYKTYDDTSSMLTDMKKSVDDDTSVSSIDAIVLPKLVYMDEILGEYDLSIAYNITELKQNYVFTLGNVGKLNDILRKYYKKWYEESYQTSYATHFTDRYFTFNNIDESSKVSFRSKRYNYGFTPNAPYDEIKDGRLIGINNAFMKSFSQIANVEISFKQYPSIENMLKDFNENKLDFFFGNHSNSKYNMDVYNTVSVLDEMAVIVSPNRSSVLINSLYSLQGQEVFAVRGTKIFEYLEANGVNVKGYSNMDDLISHRGSHLLAMDFDTYEYYRQSQLSKYKISYQFGLNDDYVFVVRDIRENQIFCDFFNFYLSFVAEKALMHQGYFEALNFKTNGYSARDYMMFGLLILIGLAIVLIVYKLFIGDRRKGSLSKEDKLRYIDMLTSLKNRNYLNDHIEFWDNSDVYPQSIVIADLNNIAYINDNYGHVEGDKVIREAANVLIKNQLENSEIIRTNGNEFLIYMVGYDEKQVVTYIRKLNKSFKELSHGFGAALGYSMILDAIKTIDDAVNEATLDMRNNKEEMNN